MCNKLKKKETKRHVGERGEGRTVGNTEKDAGTKTKTKHIWFVLLKGRGVGYDSCLINIWIITGNAESWHIF